MSRGRYFGPDHTPFLCNAICVLLLWTVLHVLILVKAHPVTKKVPYHRYFCNQFTPGDTLPRNFDCGLAGGRELDRSCVYAG